MVRLLARGGVRDFCFTPMTLVPGLRPAPVLAPDWHMLEALALALLQEVARQDGLYVELGVFDPVFLEGLRQSQSLNFERLTSRGRHFETVTYVGSSSATFRYTPASIADVSEIAINANGDIIAGKAMAHERIPPDLILGNLLTSKPRDLWRARVDRPAFQAPLKSLVAERSYWRRGCHT